MARYRRWLDPPLANLQNINSQWSLPGHPRGWTFYLHKINNLPSLLSVWNIKHNLIWLLSLICHERITLTQFPGMLHCAWHSTRSLLSSRVCYWTIKLQWWLSVGAKSELCWRNISQDIGWQFGQWQPPKYVNTSPAPSMLSSFRPNVLIFLHATLSCHWQTMGCDTKIFLNKTEKYLPTIMRTLV